MWLYEWMMRTHWADIQNNEVSIEGNTQSEFGSGVSSSKHYSLDMFCECVNYKHYRDTANLVSTKYREELKEKMLDSLISWRGGPSV